MAFDMLALPREMVAEIVKYVDYNGLLALRKVIYIFLSINFSD